MSNSDSLESILADMRQKYLEADPTDPSHSITDSQSQKQLKQKHNSLDRLLKELKQDLETNPISKQIDQIKITKEESPQKNLELERLVTQQKKQNQKIIAQKAQKWLDELDLLTGEGIWFTDLAKNYPSPLAAAIAMLESGSI